MKKSILSLAAAAAISGAFTIPVHAEDVKVKDGDTLWGISQSYKVSVEDLKEWNQLSSDIIYEGERLHISQEEHYVVKSGDTLSKIAGDFKVTLKELKSWNGLSSDTIYPKQSLVIKPAANKVEAAATGPVESTEQAQKTAEQPKQQKTVQKPSRQATTVSNETSQKQSNVKKELTVRATAYTADCQGCSGVTATGVNLKANPEAKVISVDPSVIPLGSKVYVEGYGYATAADTGSAIKGNRVDIFIADHEKAVKWGVKNVKVQVLN